MPTTVFYDSFENPDLGVPVDGYDNFDDAFSAASPFSSLSAGSGSIAFITDGNTLSQPDAPDGENYTGLHSDGTFQQETLQITLDGSERILAGQTYTLEFQSAQIDVFVFTNSGQFDIYGITEGSAPTLNNATITSSSALDAITNVDLLGTSDIISDPTFGTYSITFTATATYDRIVFAPRSTAPEGNSFLAIDDIRLTVCFTAGTSIKTNKGEIAVEDLMVGDEVQTMDNGFQPIRWVGNCFLTKREMAKKPKLRPIRIYAGSLGDQMPSKDLSVSPQHRVLVKSKIAKKMFNEEEVLIPANKLLAIDGIEIDEGIENVTYYHILFDRHEIIYSNDAPTESLFTGPEALKAVSPEARLEIETLFPELVSAEFQRKSIRYIPEKGKRMKQMAQRHQSNGKPLFSYSKEKTGVCALAG